MSDFVNGVFLERTKGRREIKACGIRNEHENRHT
jgi:hypothetical protein